MDIFLPEHKEFLLELLNSEVEFILIGGYAVNFHGYVRATGDMDIFLKPDNENKSKLQSMLEKRGTNKEDIKNLGQMDFTKPNVFFMGIKPKRIDFLTRINNVDYESANQRRVMLPLKDKMIPVLHLDDLILSKITSGRNKDITDIEELQKVNRIKK
jgi:hypothetical protein